MPEASGRHCNVGCGGTDGLHLLMKTGGDTRENAVKVAPQDASSCESQFHPRRTVSERQRRQP